MGDEIIGFDPLGKNKYDPYAVKKDINGVMQIIFEAVISRKIWICDENRYTTPNENARLLIDFSNKIFTENALRILYSYFKYPPINSSKNTKANKYKKFLAFFSYLKDYGIIKSKSKP